MKNILVIGGGGFIGSNLVKQLLKEGYNLSILEVPNGEISIFNTKIHFGRLEDFDFIKKILIDDYIDIVIHLASSLIPSSSLENYIDELDNVITPTIKLLPFLAASKIKFVYFSSGGTIYGVNETGVFSESDLTNPISYYGQSKLVLEQSILLENRRLDLDYLIIRPSNPYGIGQNIFGKQGLIAASIGHILNNQKIKIWGDGSVVRDYIHIDDLIDGVVELIKRENNNEVYNIGSGRGYSVKQIIDIFQTKLSIDFDIEYLGARAEDVPVMILNIDKYQKNGGNIKISIEEGIKDFYDYELFKKTKIK